MTCEFSPLFWVSQILYTDKEFFAHRYPVKMIPGCHITLHTTATTDKDARLLLSALGIPFHGKFVN